MPHPLLCSILEQTCRICLINCSVFVCLKRKGSFTNADAKSDFQKLPENYKSQRLTGYCGVESDVAVLNALDVGVTQPTFLSSDASNVTSRWKVIFKGMNLNLLAACWKHKVKSHPSITLVLFHSKNFETFCSKFI